MPRSWKKEFNKYGRRVRDDETFNDLAQTFDLFFEGESTRIVLAISHPEVLQEESTIIIIFVLVFIVDTSGKIAS